MTGTWAAGIAPVSGSFSSVPISFSIPLAAALPAAKVHYINQAGEEVVSGGPPVPDPPNCNGTAAAPAADPGHLCVYVGYEEAMSLIAIYQVDGVTNGASVSGAFAQVSLSSEGSGAGSWAVTAEN